MTLLYMDERKKKKEPNNKEDKKNRKPKEREVALCFLTQKLNLFRPQIPSVGGDHYNQMFPYQMRGEEGMRGGGLVVKRTKRSG